MASEKAETPAADILRQLKENAPTIHKLSEQLTSRIKRFEDWCDAIPGRVETWWCFRVDGDELTCRFHRDGKRWIISWDFEPWENATWRPLTDAPLEVKLAAIETFPEVPGHMLRAQQQLEERLRGAHESLKELAKQFGDTLKEDM